MRPRRGGFTLIEVMVALAIVALTLAAGLRAVGALTDNAQRLADVMAAQWCAENQLVDLRVQSVLPGNGESEFSCQQLGRTYRGKLLVRPLPANSDVLQLQVVIRDDSDTFLVSVATLMAR